MNRKLLLFAATILFAFNLFSQTEKGDIILSIDGNYSKSTTENGVTRNQFATEGKHLDIGTSVGYFITSRLIAGIGLDYIWGKEDRFNELMINKFYQSESTNIKSKIFLPNIYLGYYYPITNRLYVNINSKFSYGKIKSEYESLCVSLVDDSSSNGLTTDDDFSGIFINEGSLRADYFGIDIIPELSFFISSRFSICLGLGGISYSMLDWETDRSDLAINFNPTYWRTGFKIKL